MPKIPQRKISDFTQQKNLIPGGRINQYLQHADLKQTYKSKRSPLFPFKKDIDYIDQNYITRQYKIKGFEYGNWVSQDERFNFLICGHLALYDIAKIMQFPENNVGFVYTLGIAFGARGHGGNAAAHFEPHTFMINLTKTSGWQSLAHEYGHALDFYFGGYIDQDKSSFSLSKGQSVAKEDDLTAYKKDSLRYLMNDLINSINTVQMNGKTVSSESYNNLEKAAGNTDYWYRRTEIFARFFERYVMYRLSKLGIKNTFLTKEKYESRVYVTKSDFNRVLPKMEKLVKALRKV
ncbi:MAG: LPD1 domain-containing protein [Bacteroidia bacterium]